MYETIKFNLAREALRYIVKTYKIKEIHIPYYLCDVIRHTLFEEKCNIKFYHIDDNFMPACDFKTDEYILYPNYFGVFSGNIKFMASKYPNLIVDNAHAYYDEPQGLACFNAGHKFGYKDSILWIKDSSIQSKDIFIDRQKAEQRKKIFFEFCQKYDSSNLIKFNFDAEVYSSTAPYVYPYVYPFLAESIQEADGLVKQLENEGKTIYRYWNPLPPDYNEYKFYSRLVPIPLQ